MKMDKHQALEIRKVLEDYMAQGYQWIFNYKNQSELLRDINKPTRLFVKEPWFSIEGGMTWVDIPSCIGYEGLDKPAIFIELEIPELPEPLKLDAFIKAYLEETTI